MKAFIDKMMAKIALWWDVITLTLSLLNELLFHSTRYKGYANKSILMVDNHDIMSKAFPGHTGLALVARNIVMLDTSEMPECAKQFVRYHELGHCALKHYLGFDQGTIDATRQAAIRNDSVLIEELEADRYAALHIGTDVVIEALEWYKGKYVDNNIVLLELNNRQLYLQQNGTAGMILA